MGSKTVAPKNWAIFHDQIFEKVDQCVTSSGQFEVINRRYVEAGLRQCALRPDDLFLPAKQRMFAAVLEKQDQSFDYLLFCCGYERNHA